MHEGRTIRFYSDGGRMREDVVSFLLEGLRRGEAVIVVATGEHRAVFNRLLAAQGVDVAAVEQARQLIQLDAARTLAEFMAGPLETGIPSGQKFRDLVTATLRDVAFPRVRVYGEMGSLLFARGNQLGSARLQSLWNEVAATRGFDLYTVYEMGSSSPSLTFERVTRRRP
jgi:hypothetical protein